MKRTVLVIFLLLFGSSNVNATLYDRGNGMIYSSILDMTWLQNTHSYGMFTWNEAVEWADNLEYRGYNDWRLPTSYVNDGEYEKNSEFGILYHNELGNDWRLSWYGLPFNSGPFVLSSIAYWSSGENESSNPNYPSEDWALGFFWDDGTVFLAPKTTEYNVWAVRDGDVHPIPETTTLLLFGSGLVGLFGAKIRKKKPRLSLY